MPGSGSVMGPRGHGATGPQSHWDKGTQGHGATITAHPSGRTRPLSGETSPPPGGLAARRLPAPPPRGPWAGRGPRAAPRRRQSQHAARPAPAPAAAAAAAAVAAAGARRWRREARRIWRPSARTWRRCSKPPSARATLGEGGRRRAPGAGWATRAAPSAPGGARPARGAPSFPSAPPSPPPTAGGWRSRGGTGSRGGAGTAAPFCSLSPDLGGSGGGGERPGAAPGFAGPGGRGASCEARGGQPPVSASAVLYPEGRKRLGLFFFFKPEIIALASPGCPEARPRLSFHALRLNFDGERVNSPRSSPRRCEQARPDGVFRSKTGFLASRKRCLVGRAGCQHKNPWLKRCRLNKHSLPARAW